MSRTQQMFEVPSILSFSDDTVKLAMSGRNYKYTPAYVPTAEVKNELKKISGKLEDCLYDINVGRRSRDINTLRPILHIDKEIEVLMAAQEDVKQSRQNLRRRTVEICPSIAYGPSKEEKREFKIMSLMNRSSAWTMYEFDDFKQDFDTKPYFATDMVDFSLERIQNSIQLRQLAFEKLRREIYAASVLRVKGYFIRPKEARGPRMETPVVTKYKCASKNTFEKSNRNERWRLEKNLGIFNGKLQEFLDARRIVQEDEEVSSKRKHQHNVKTVKLDVNMLKQTNVAYIDYQEEPVQRQRRRRRRRGNRVPRVEIQDYVESCDHKRAEKRQKGSDGDVTEVMQPLSEAGSHIDLTQGSLREEGSDVEIKELVILPLPTLNPMPVYTDNCQASCILTQLCSSRDDFDEDFEPDCVIPPYECERMVYTIRANHQPADGPSYHM